MHTHRNMHTCVLHMYIFHVNMYVTWIRIFQSFYTPLTENNNLMLLSISIRKCLVPWIGGGVLAYLMQWMCCQNTTHRHTHRHTCITRMYGEAHVYVYVHTHTLIYTYINTPITHPYTHIHTRTFTQTYTCTLACFLLPARMKLCCTYLAVYIHILIYRNIYMYQQAYICMLHLTGTDENILYTASRSISAFLLPCPTPAFDVYSCVYLCIRVFVYIHVCLHAER